jgi:hypothetical protein
MPLSGLPACQARVAAGAEAGGSHTWGSKVSLRWAKAHGQRPQEQTVSPSRRRSNWSPQRAQVGGSRFARTKSARIRVAQKARYGTTRAGEFMFRLIGRPEPVV